MKEHSAIRCLQKHTSLLAGSTYCIVVGLKELPRTVLDVRIVKWTSHDDGVTQLYVRAMIICKTSKSSCDYD